MFGSIAVKACASLVVFFFFIYLLFFGKISAFVAKLTSKQERHRYMRKRVLCATELPSKQYSGI